MNDTERLISAFLHEEAQRSSPSNEMYRRVLRRAKLRRLIATGVASVAIVTIVMAGVVTVGALRSPLTTPPEGKQSESQTPRDQDVGPNTVVGQGTVSGQAWSLVAYESADGLCVDLQVGSGTVVACGFDVPSRRDLGLGESSQRGVSKTAIYGVVSKRVLALQATLNDGERIDVDIIQSPAGFDVNFFAAFLPPDAEAVIEARDNQGALLERLQTSPLPERPR